MRTRRAFKRTIGILAVLLILSAALNIALIIMLSKANGGANAAEPMPTPEMSDTAEPEQPTAEPTAEPRLRRSPRKRQSPRQHQQRSLPQRSSPRRHQQ